jgi:hypothetical protein
VVAFFFSSWRLCVVKYCRRNSRVRN